MDKYFIKVATKIFIDYFTTVFLFCIFAISVLLLATPESARIWWIVYSLVWFLMLMMMIYAYMKKIAQKEIIPQYEIKAYPFKGFVYGLFAMIPNFVVAFLHSVIIFENEIFESRKLLAVKLFFSPLHAFVQLFGDNMLSFYLVCLVVPVIAGLGYLSGYYGIYPLAKLTGKSD